MTTCVYTAIAGNYDQLRPVPPQTTSCEFVAFVDTLDYDEVAGWRIVPFPRDWPPGADAREAAKWFKVLGPSIETDEGPWTRVLPQHDVTIWIDGGHEVISHTFVEEAVAGLGDSGFTLHKHPNRDCIYPEADLSLTLPKYCGSRIREQVEFYRRSEGHPAHWGLWATGTLVRRRSLELDELMSDWWDEITDWSMQCQISLPVVLRRHGMRPQQFAECDRLGVTCQLSGPWVRLHAHADGSL